MVPPRPPRAQFYTGVGVIGYIFAVCVAAVLMYVIPWKYNLEGSAGLLVRAVCMAGPIFAMGGLVRLLDLDRRAAVATAPWFVQTLPERLREELARAPTRKRPSGLAAMEGELKALERYCPTFPGLARARQEIEAARSGEAADGNQRHDV